MSWSDYHLDHPAFCTPLPVLRGLVSALCERREAVDSDFHGSCIVSSGARDATAAAETANTVLLEPGAAFMPPRDERAAVFTPIGKTNDWHSSGYTFMEHFDGELELLVERGAYVDSSGAVYSSSVSGARTAEW